MNFKTWNIYLFFIALLSIKAITENIISGLILISIIVAIYSYLFGARIASPKFWKIAVFVYSSIIILKIIFSIYIYFTGQVSPPSDMPPNLPFTFLYLSAVMLGALTYLPAIYATLKISRGEYHSESKGWSSRS